MKKFLFFILKIFLIVILLAFVLDLVYTTSFRQSSGRDKIGYIYNSKPQKFDVVILGSSRANYHFVNDMFRDKGLKSFNFGMESSKLFETDLVLKLLLEKKHKIKNVIIDVDVTLASDEKSTATVLKFLPYLHDSKVVKAHFASLPEYNSWYYIPFYRYMKFENAFSFREILSCGLKIKSHRLDNGGYIPLEGQGELKLDITKWTPHRNKYYEEIKRICQKNNINLIAVMTPMCENVVGMNYFDKVEQLYPEIHNYENVVVENKYFSSCGHMNDAGARIFTARILKDFFKK